MELGIPGSNKLPSLSEFQEIPLDLATPNPYKLPQPVAALLLPGQIAVLLRFGRVVGSRHSQSASTVGPLLLGHRSGSAALVAAVHIGLHPLG